MVDIDTVAPYQSQVLRVLIVAGRPSRWYSRHDAEMDGSVEGDVSLPGGAVLSRVWWRGNGGLRLNAQRGQFSFRDRIAADMSELTCHVAFSEEDIIELPFAENMGVGARHVNLGWQSDSERALLSGVRPGDRINLVISDVS